MLLRYFDLSNLFNFMQVLPPAWIEKTYYYTNDKKCHFSAKKT